MVLISAQRILMMPHPYIEPQLKVALRLLRYAYTRYLLLVFSKLVDINFRAFWLVPVTRTIVGYSLFWDGIQNGFSFRDSFEGWNFSGKWNSCTNKYQETDKIGLVGVYWSIEIFFFYWICNKIIKNGPQNTVNWNVTKWPSFSYKKLLFDFYPTDLIKTKTTIPLRVGS